MKTLILTVLLALFATTSAILTDLRPVTMSSEDLGWGYPSPASADNDFNTF
jgi:hypothetical protein